VQAIEAWSISAQLADFTAGVLSLAGAAYFLAILVVMLYVSMVLIGRRHWFSGEGRSELVAHYVVRTLALALVGVGVVGALGHHNLRIDATSEKLSSLSPQTVALLHSLKVERPVQIEAFVSPQVPEKYVQSRMTLLRVLDALSAAGGGKIQTQVHDTDRFTEEAALADRTYGIEAREVTTLSHGVLKPDHIYLHVAVKCGLQKEPVMFIDQDTPVEYDLIRAICTVTQQKREKLGILTTDAQLYGGINFQTMGSNPNWPIVDELAKQYELVRVDPSKPIAGNFKALLAVQPSTLGPQEMNNFIEAVRGGMPTAILEDPAPIWCQMPATSMPRQSPGGMPFMQPQRLPKGDISQLWDLLGVDFTDRQVVWQNYNPYPKIEQLGETPEFVFVGKGSGAAEPFNPNDPISSGLQQMLFPFPGAARKLNASNLDFIPLATTGDKTGTVNYSELVEQSPMGTRLNPNAPLLRTRENYVLAAHIRGKVALSPAGEPENPPAGAKGKKPEPPKPKYSNLNVVLVADADMLSQFFFQLRERTEIPDLDIHLNLDNIAFVLNALDSLAGDNRFIDVRKRRPKYRTLTRIEQWTEKDRKEAADEIEKYQKDVKAEGDKLQKGIDDKLAEMKQKKDVDPQQLAIDLIAAAQELDRQKAVKVEQLRREADQARVRTETHLAAQIRAAQSWAKLMTVLLPPIPPLAIALVVFLTRRSREREGVARSRLR
jgi:ABC-2 type transport system permease protein